MIVERVTYHVKPGHMPKFIELVKAETAKFDHPPKMRMYRSYIGQGLRLAIEFDFENLAELENFWGPWSAKPETAEWVRKVSEVIESQGIEIWTLVEM